MLVFRDDWAHTRHLCRKSARPILTYHLWTAAGRRPREPWRDKLYRPSGLSGRLTCRPARWGSRPPFRPEGPDPPTLVGAGFERFLAGGGPGPSPVPRLYTPWVPYRGPEAATRPGLILWAARRRGGFGPEGTWFWPSWGLYQPLDPFMDQGRCTVEGVLSRPRAGMTCS